MADITKGSKIDKRFDSLFKGMMADIDFALSVYLVRYQRLR